MDTLLAAAVVVAAVVAWTVWESTMVSRIARDTRSLPRRNAAVAGAHRLTVVGQLGLVAVAAVVAGLVQVPLWWPAAAASPAGLAATAAAVVLAGCAAGWAARRGHRPQDRRALVAVAATAFATEVLLRGFGLGLLEAAGWPVTAAVLVTSVATGLLQAARARRGSRAYGFVLATLLGFLLGLVVLLTGSVVAAAGIHMAVAALSLGRSFPARDHAPGCACGTDHGAPAAATGTSREARGAATSAATAAAARSAGGATPTGAATVHGTGTGTGTDAASAPGQATPGPAAANGSGHGSAHGPHASHASCGTTCSHAGSSACAVCPLSTARV